MAEQVTALDLSKESQNDDSMEKGATGEAH